ncbi:MAG TPA: nuclear transport factor 2 family protein [Solirubrobacteraceae bacterium]|nr:nuclear transport factor 2 family protein [Solirubrobacteraceae bacterium]
MPDQSNVDVLKSAYGAFQSGDIPGVMAALDPDVRMHAPDVLPHGGDFDGHDGAGRFFAGIGEKWDGLAVEAQDIVADGERVVVIGRASGRLRGEGDDVAYGFVHAWTMRDGRAVRFDEYVDPAELLATA